MSDTPQTIVLLQDIVTLLKQTQATPWKQLLWSAEDIARHLGVSPRTVAERYAPRPDFPVPTLIGKSYRWYAHEVCDWVAEQRR